MAAGRAYGPFVGGGNRNETNLDRALLWKDQPEGSDYWMYLNAKVGDCSKYMTVSTLPPGYTYMATPMGMPIRIDMSFGLSTPSPVIDRKKIRHVVSGKINFLFFEGVRA